MSSYSFCKYWRLTSLIFVWVFSTLGCTDAGTPTASKPVAKKNNKTEASNSVAAATGDTKIVSPGSPFKTATSTTTQVQVGQVGEGTNKATELSGDKKPAANGITWQVNGLKGNDEAGDGTMTGNIKATLPQNCTFTSLPTVFADPEIPGLTPSALLEASNSSISITLEGKTANNLLPVVNTTFTITDSETISCGDILKESLSYIVDKIIFNPNFLQDPSAINVPSETTWRYRGESVIQNLQHYKLGLNKAVEMQSKVFKFIDGKHTFREDISASDIMAKVSYLKSSDKFENPYKSGLAVPPAVTVTVVRAPDGKSVRITMESLSPELITSDEAVQIWLEIKRTAIAPELDFAFNNYASHFLALGAIFKLF